VAEFETVLTEVYVLVDDAWQALPPLPPHPGPPAALAESEVITLALLSQFRAFASEAVFYRYAAKRLRGAFPRLPSRPQFTRQVLRLRDRIAAVGLHLGRALAAEDRAFEILDGTGVATRNCQRRGAGWLAGEADIGRCTRLGYYEGVRLLLCCTPKGAITGFGIAPASTNDRVLADQFLAARALAMPELATVGTPTSDAYVADLGFSGKVRERSWLADWGARVICAPLPNSKRVWPKALRRWLAGHRQVMETVTDRVLAACGVLRLRPHGPTALQARVAAAVALFNACAAINRDHGRPWLTVIDLVECEGF
jgi:hypothetical protein